MISIIGVVRSPVGRVIWVISIPPAAPAKPYAKAPAAVVAIRVSISIIIIRVSPKWIIKSGVIGIVVRSVERIVVDVNRDLIRVRSPGSLSYLIIEFFLHFFSAIVSRAVPFNVSKDGSFFGNLCKLICFFSK